VIAETAFWAQVSKAQTLADGGIRVTFDLPESAIVQMAELAAYQINGVVVDVIVKPRPEKQVEAGGQTGNVEAGPKRKSKWATAQEPGADRHS